MLPSPVSHRQKLVSSTRSGVHVPTSLAFWRLRLATLLGRSRITNLGVLVLVSCLVLSVVHNLRVGLGSDGVERDDGQAAWWSGRGTADGDANGHRERIGAKKLFKDTDDAPVLKENDRERVQDATKQQLARIPPSIDSTIRRPPALRSLTHLVLVPCHGVWVGNAPDDALDTNKWVLEAYDGTVRSDRAREDGLRVKAFVEHVKKAVEIASADPSSLLVFSGAPTRPPTPHSESSSYLSLALSLGLISPSSPDSLFLRTTTEEHALDSFQNLLFGLARFKEVVGSPDGGGGDGQGYPKRVTVVGFGIKKRRFEELHAKAVRWPIGEVEDWKVGRLLREGEEEEEEEESMPLPRWTYVGIDMEGTDEVDRAQRGELANGYGPFFADLYGCHGALLRKRRLRNPYRRVHAYHTSAPEMAGLLEWCPDAEVFVTGGGDDVQAEGDGSAAVLTEVYTKIYPGKLPWIEDEN